MPSTSLTKNRRIHGFTLIELSIVLVIIALVVAGIFTGQALIFESQIRSTLSQLEKYKTTVNTFKLKYGCLPGDCTNASRLWSSASNGSGNGMVDPSYWGGWAGTYAYPGTENNYFWDHLYQANLIEGYGLPAVGGITFSSVASLPTRLNNRAVFSIAYVVDATTGIVGSGYGVHAPMQARHIFYLGTASATNDVDHGVLTGSQGRALDAKIDDGVASTGTTFAGAYNGFAMTNFMYVASPYTGTTVNMAFAAGF